MTARPNILWVFADQMRGHAMSCAGDVNVRTPNLDQLAQRGVRFTNACSSYPLCVPFRFTLLTGEYAHTRWIPALDWRMSPAERTIAHEFNDAGYHTCYIGKWHLDGSTTQGDAKAINRMPVAPNRRGGFREWHGFNLRNGFFDTCVFHGDDPTPVPLGKYQTDGLFDITLDCLKERGQTPDDPFFMVLSVEAPHPPHEAPEEYLERIRQRGVQARPNVSWETPADGLEYPPGCRWTERWADSNNTGYYAQIENLDDNMGRLLAGLEEMGLAENTYVFFFSDHGEFLGSHGMRSKQDPREESINIPFIVHGPGIESGGVLDEAICTEDIYPTTLSLAGLEPPSPKPGLDLGTYLRGDIDQLPRDGVYLEMVEEHRPPMVFYKAPYRGIRTRTHLYAVLNGAPWLLFDLTTDPYQQDNLVRSEEHAPLRRELHTRLVQMAEETDDSYVFGDPDQPVSAPAVGTP
jgi:arylsulfatase A-like enzyme